MVNFHLKNTNKLIEQNKKHYFHFEWNLIRLLSYMHIAIYNHLMCLKINDVIKYKSICIAARQNVPR